MLSGMSGIGIPECRDGTTVKKVNGTKHIGLVIPSPLPSVPTRSATLAQTNLHKSLKKWNEGISNAVTRYQNRYFKKHKGKTKDQLASDKRKLENKIRQIDQQLKIVGQQLSHTVLQLNPWKVTIEPRESNPIWLILDWVKSVDILSWTLCPKF